MRDDAMLPLAVLIRELRCNIYFPFVGFIHDAVEETSLVDGYTYAMLKVSETRHGCNFHNIRKESICLKQEPDVVHERNESGNFGVNTRVSDLCNCCQSEGV